MSDKNIFNFHGFGKWLIEQYRMIQVHQRQNDAILRIVEVNHENKRAEPTFKIQLVGKNYFVEKSLTEILSHPNILEAFSRKDVETLVRLQTQWELMPKVTLKAHYSKDGSTKVVLEDAKGKSMTETVENLGKNKELLKNLSAKDAYLLGFLNGSEES